MKRKFNILFGLHEISGALSSLASGFQSLGYKSEFLSIAQHRYSYDSFTAPSLLISIWRFSIEKRSQTLRTKLTKKIVYYLFNQFMNLILILRTIIKYDVINFSYGITFTNSELEMWLYRLFRVKTIFTFYGSDARPAYLSAKYSTPIETIDYKLVQTITMDQKKRILRIEKYASSIISYLPQSHLQERSFLDLLLIGLPVNIPHSYQSGKKLSRRNTDTIKILHSPSDMNIKGTAEIHKIIAKIRNKGFKIELISLNNVSHEQVLEEINNCDFIVDQMYSSTPMPFLVLEGAYFGKPSILGGYFCDQISKHYDAQDIPPSLYVHPSQMESAIELWVVDEKSRLKVGDAASSFARHNWNIKKVVERYINIVEGDIPLRWYVNPNDNMYDHAGFPDSNLKILIHNMIDMYGIESLQLSDKSKLAAKFKQLGLLIFT